MDWFNVFKDEHGNMLLVVPPRAQDDVAEQLRMIQRQGVSEYVAITILQDRIAALEALLAPLSPLPPGARPATVTMQRRGRVDRVPYGWKVSTADDTKLVPNRAETETIALIRVLAGRGLSYREVCRRLDQQGHLRRGEKWSGGGGHNLVRCILKRAGARGRLSAT